MTAADLLGVPAAEQPRGRTRSRGRAVPAGVVVALLFLVVTVLVVAFPGLFTTTGPLDANPALAFQPPGAAHWLGTDELGRDVFSRILYGARYSLFIGLAATVIGVAAGVLLGLVAGLGGKVTDEVTARLLDVIAAFPGILLAIVMITIVGRGIPTLIVALGIWWIPRYARIVRAETQVVKESGYVEQALTFGLTRGALIWRHVLPHAVRSIPILATMGLGFSILAASSLSFLGLGAQPPSPEWGAMLSDGRNYVDNAWWISVFPGLAIVLVVLAVSTVGRHLQRRLENRDLV